MIRFWQFLFVQNFFTYTITYNTCPRHNNFNFCDFKNFFRTVWSIDSCKNSFIFWYSNKITNFKFLIFIINFFARVNLCAWFYIQQVSSLLRYDLYCCIFKGSNESFSNSRFSFIKCFYHYIIILQKGFHWSIMKFTAFVDPYFVWFLS